MRWFLLKSVVVSCLLLAQTSFAAQAQVDSDSDPEAVELIRAAMDQWRGKTSKGITTMVIHRDDWERTMTIRSWSSGDKKSLVQVLEPKKDAGNGTLLSDDNMWSYTPKINRVIKIPSSMLNQSWMGSDFSNRDISKSTDIIDDYTHELTHKETVDGHTYYTITSIPHEEAAVVWGKEVHVVRDDFVMIEDQFWDQDDKLVKVMKSIEIEEMGGRQVAKVLRIHKSETPNEWTEMRTEEIEFDIELPDGMFTLSKLRNPRK